MTYARQFLLSAPAGRRYSVPGVVVIIADEKSTDDLSQPAAAVRADGKSHSINPSTLMYTQTEQTIPAALSHVHKSELVL